MAQKESAPDEPKNNLMPTQLATVGRNQIDEFIKMQTELLDKLWDTYRQWFDRAQTEADLASEFASKLSVARSIPEAMTACREWPSLRFAIIAEDSKHLEQPEIHQTGARLMSDAWAAENGGISP
jgi:hypothetical protein